jgi:hypothetical protein
MSIAHWLAALIQDPDGSPSSARVIGVLCGVVACIVALTSLAIGHEYAATVAALVGGGASALLTRRKSEGSE